MKIKTFLTKKRTIIEYKIDEIGNIFEKKCSVCGVWKIIDQYGNLKGSFINKKNFCHYCDAEKAKNLRKKNGSRPQTPFTKIIKGVIYRECLKCLKIKSLNEFDNSTGSFLDHESRCKNCKKISGEKQRRAKGIKPQRIIPVLKDKKGTVTHRECTKCFKMLTLENFNKGGNSYLKVSPYCKRCNENARLVREYGITLLQKEEIAKEQNYQCKLCNRQFEFRKLCVDHCHKTNKIRNLLCDNCNAGLGLLKEDKDIIDNTINYIEFHNHHMILLTDEEFKNNIKVRQKSLYRRNKKVRKNQKVPILNDVQGNITHRECYYCLSMLPLENYDKHKYSKLGVRAWCKECSSERTIYAKYGITIKQKNEMYKFQENKCKICQVNKDISILNIDHCHRSGKVRGLLCDECNWAIEGIKENIQILKNMIEYINIHNMENNKE